MCHLTEMMCYTISLFTFTQLTSQNANFKRFGITKFINKLTTSLYIYRKRDIVYIILGQLNILM